MTGRSQGSLVAFLNWARTFLTRHKKGGGTTGVRILAAYEEAEPAANQRRGGSVPKLGRQPPADAVNRQRSAVTAAGGLSLAAQGVRVS